MRALLAFVAALPLIVSAAQAAEYPEKPVRVVIPFGPGSATDVIPRIVLDRMGSQLGQQFIVENKAGAGSTLGESMVAKAEPDGYQLLATSSAHTIAPALYSNLNYDSSRDFTAVGVFGTVPNVLIISPSRGIKNLQEFVAAAKAKPDALSFASLGVGSAVHMSAERFRLAAGYQAVHVPFKGGAEALTEIMAGRVDYYFCPIATALPFIKEGKLLALAVSSPTRAAALPDVPTTLESGFPNSDYTIWIALFAPAKTPAPIIAKLNAALNAAAQAPETKAKLDNIGVQPMALTPPAFGKMVKDEMAIYGEFVKAAGMKVN